MLLRISNDSKIVQEKNNHSVLKIKEYSDETVLFRKRHLFY